MRGLLVQVSIGNVWGASAGRSMNETTDEGVQQQRPGKNSRMVRWLKYALGGIAGSIVLLAIIGAVYESIGSSLDRRIASMPGRLVDVGGYKMHLDCIGEDLPAVILESGLGDSWLSWYKVQPAISKFARVCSYDRAGPGFSDPRPEASDSRNVAHNLRSLLRAAGVNPPYVLVGHSIGGIHVRVYQSLYPNDVIGMVLVDSSHPDMVKRLPREVVKRLSPPFAMLDLMALTAPVGLPRWMGVCTSGPPEIAAMQRSFECRGQNYKAIEAEFRAIDPTTSEGRQAGSVGAIPLVVLSEDPNVGPARGVLPPDLNRQYGVQWAQLQEELARLSSYGGRVVATGSGHYVHQDRPDLVIAAVEKIVSVARGPK